MCLLMRTILLWMLIILVDAGRVRHHHGTGKQGLKFLKNRGIGTNFLSKSGTSSNAGLWPAVFNVATKSVISVNATCGEGGREEYCRMSENAKGRCYVCDNFSPDPTKQHPIHHAIDGTGKWWQSPALYRGREYEYVTVTLDLKQTYQVAYVIIKAAISPRPGSWILERSLDGENFKPWQYFGTSEKDCLERYGIQAKKGKPHYSTDTEVICTTFFSKLTPLENGEIHTSLVYGRPGANETSPALLEFTKARYVRFRLQGFRGSAEAPLPKRLSQDNLRDRKLFYSIKDINIGGQCVCNGHASSCRHNVASGHPECECAHHTCGPNCDKCCPLYNQRLWGPGTPREARQCLPCNCHGHAKSCHYDEDIDRTGLSLDVTGNYQGGGVCDNCTSHTTGINCERCIRGYYRPKGISPDDKTPCLKCDCDPLGSTGSCTVEEETVLCDCRPGYSGVQCDSCAPGYRGYPNCEVCPCDPRGVANVNDCEGQCMCKVNVEGAFCERCKSGYFSLQESNPDGCYSCYCSGVTTLCESAILIQQTFKTREGWHVSDINITDTEKITLDDQGILSVANYEVLGGGSYYWLAPNLYLGNKLIVYGSVFTFRVLWIVMRGDTSGKPTRGPNIILIGTNGKKIAYGNDLFSTTNVTFKIPMMENDWYYFESSENENDVRGVNRSDFLSILADLKHILLRAKFHTDQIEVALEEAAFNIGEGVSLVEKCSCPSGYTGLSCESCDYGYVRIFANTSDDEQSFCGKCDCNAHSKTCDPDTGQCLCEHNTTGENCDRCLPGFYGNPLAGTPYDCRQCACPLLNEENNFSPSCQLDLFAIGSDYEEQGYVCTQCPKGYTGDHCEICDDGYFGEPMELGQSCQLCNCGGNPCDRKTGQCLACKGNTEGWRCERCKPGYFGDPTTANCQSCLCDPIGSKSEDCNNVTGQCECKDKFVGRTCDKCMAGYGNITAGCVECDCNEMGSKSDICDPRTGLCDCQIGVEGFHCDACQHLHYGFSEIGCQSCNCNPKGSELHTCDIKTGNCRCKPNYVGRTCDKCESGYWENASGCAKCDCNSEGSRTSACEQTTGRCYCKEGVGGDKCDVCAKGYYGFSESGCKQCDDCKKPGHICDSKTGRCVCPPNSHGVHCEKCLPNTWGHEPQIGCRKCNCSKFGRKKQECNVKTGACVCEVGYSGQNCDKCAFGYYGYPKCRPCNCNRAGIDRSSANCSGDLCQCNNDGQCPCKRNVIGRNCNKCKEETFGLDISNPNGCTKCFCFGRSRKCQNAPYIWDQIPSNHILLDNLFRKRNSLYWKLPHVFQEDRILSYNGYLRFKIETKSNRLPKRRIDPLVILEGNGLEIYYYLLSSQISPKFEIRLQEDMWRTPTNAKINRMDFMIILQNVTDIYIKSADTHSYNNSVLLSVTLDTAIEVKGNPYRPAIGVEICECPSQYTSTSCQTPNSGYCRHHASHITSSFGKVNIDSVIGRSTPCKCHGRSKTCDSETCKCQNCTDNTDGINCEKCAEGFYGNPMVLGGVCHPCPCPTPDRNFAVSCDIKHGTCICKPGYVGAKCERCAAGYYGNPLEKNGSCRPCDCMPEGITTPGCDSNGQCHCKRGIIGKKCSICEKPRHVLQDNVCIPCDNCTQKLLDHVEKLQTNLYANTSHLLHGKLEPPWEKLDEYETKYSKLAKRFNVYRTANNKAKELIERANVDDYERNLGKLREGFQTQSLKLDVLVKDIIKTHNQTLNADTDLKQIKQNLIQYTENLNNFGRKHIPTKEAVKEGNAILEHIRQQYNKVQNMNPDAIINKCRAINDFLESINKNNPMNLLMNFGNDLNDIKDFLDSANEITVNTSRTIKNVVDTNLRNEKALKTLRNILADNKDKPELLNNEIKYVNDLIAQAKRARNQTETTLAKIADENLKGLVGNLTDRQNKLKTAIHLLENNFNAAKNHTKMVELKVKDMQKIFQKDDKQVNAEKASEAYAKIVNLLNEANETALEAKKILQKLKDEIEPEGMDSLSQSTYISSANASQLERRILNTLNYRAPDVQERIMKIQNLLNEIKNKNWDNGIKDGELNALINQLLNEHNYNGDITNVTIDAITQSDTMKDVYEKAVNIKNFQIPYDLNKKMDKLRNMTSPNETSEIKKKIIEARTKVQNILKNFPSIKLSDQNITLNLKPDDITLKLEELKAKIRKAREIADGIRVSMSGSSCTRSYRLTSLESSMVTNLKIKFSLNTTHPTSLFYLSNNDGQFMHLFLTSNNSITFDLKLTKADRKHDLSMPLRKNENIIEIERIFNIVRMSVNDKSKEMNIKNGNIPFNVNPTNLIHVGNVINGMKGLPGCIHDIVFNDKKIGLWQFEKSSHCDGCSRFNTTTDSTPTYRFNGEGYLMIKEKKDLGRNARKFDISFWLKTFDENALLFLAPHNKTGSFLALTLNNGHVQYEVHYDIKDEIPPLILKTQKKYNDGKKYFIDVRKLFENNEEQNRLKVGQEALPIKVSKIKGNQLLKIKKVNFYIGGVPPDYFLYSMNGTDSLHTHQSLLGDIEKFTLNQGFVTLSETTTLQHQYGIQLSDKPFEFRRALLEGTGYIKLKLQEFKFSSGLIFIIKTTDNNSFIMNVENLATFFLKDGRISVNVMNKTLNSKEKVNDDEYHTVELKKLPQTYVLKVDGTKVDKQEISNQSISGDEQDIKSLNLFIGGIPNVTEPSQYFNGEIGDLFIIDKAVMEKSLQFSTDTLDNFNNVKIGRRKPRNVITFSTEDEVSKDNLRSRTLSDSENIEGCDKSTNNSLELNAAKFGDLSESYVKYYLKDLFWKEDFSIQLVFRTFYKNGMLLFAQGDTKHYNLLELKEGSIILHVVGRRKKSLHIPKRFDDGEWHKIIMENKSKKRKRKLTITIDGRREKPKKIPQNKVAGDVFIGGIPQTVQQKLPKQLSSKLTPFKGCIKELRINKEPQNFLDHHQIGLCFSNIERGSYFRGDAYAIYKRNFKVTNFLELKFEFRTREQNGILMSISTANNSPALSLELQNSAIVMSVNMGNGVISNVTNFHSTYALCDNKWHNVTALFSTELTVNVDGVSKSWVISEMGMMDEIEDPLYIGGLPDSAPAGTLKIRENFKGCIRNVKIGENYIDWIDMEELTNVSLNSCPVA